MDVLTSSPLSPIGAASRSATPSYGAGVSLHTNQVPAENRDWTPQEYGTFFKSSAAGRITAVRFYANALETGNHVGHIWTAAGVELASTSFAALVAGWNTAYLSSPLAVTAGTVYMVSCNANAYYRATFNLGQHISNGVLTTCDSTGSTSSSLHSFDRYGTPIGAFPGNVGEYSDFFVDVVFEPTL